MPTEPESTSKVYIRYYDFNKYYETDDQLPAILDVRKNGGKQTGMTEGEWLAFCAKLDLNFRNMNFLQTVNFCCWLFVVVITVVYLLLIFLIISYSPSYVWITYSLVVAAVVNFVFQLIIQFPMNQMSLERAKFLCREESAKLNLQLASNNLSVCVVINLIYTKWNSVRCGKGYEADSQNRQRNREVYLEISAEGLGGTTNDIDRMYPAKRNIPASTRVLGDTNLSPEADLISDVELQEVTRSTARVYVPQPMEPYIQTVPMAAASYAST